MGTPVYFGNMSSLCKAFLDRCIVFHKDKPLANKVAGVLAVGRAAERRTGTDDPLGASGLDVAADDRGGRCLADRSLGRHRMGREPRRQRGPTPDLARDVEGIATVKNLGRRVAEMALRLDAAGPASVPRPR